MKIFVTGGSGFIGSNFILNHINKKDIQILNYDKLTYSGNILNLVDIEKKDNYSFIKGDICDEEKIQEAFSNFCPDALINFAAESHVDRSIDDPIPFINTNVLGTTILLKVASKHYKHNSQNFKFLHVSTDEIFGSLGKSGLFTEDSPLKPNSPYSASKTSSNHIVQAWFKTYDLPILITNCSNNYGPFQFPEKLIPLIIANCLDNKPLPIYGDGQNVRDWLYVSDHCEAIYQVLLNGNIGESYNIGGNNEMKNIDIVEQICSILDESRPLSKRSYKDLITFVDDRPGHDYRYAIDSSKIKTKIGWSPQESFESGLKKTISWYLKNEAWWRQIQEKKYSQERLGLNG